MVAIGWHEIGPLNGLSREEITERVASEWPHWSKGRVVISAGQLYRFANELAVGDRVLTYDKGRRLYLVGRVTSEYRFDPEPMGADGEYPNLREVDWQGAVKRDDLSGATRNSLGAISTLFQISPDAAKEVEAVLSGSAKPAAEPEDAQAEDDAPLRDIEAQAKELIKDQVSRLDWQEMQELVAGLLRGMGYKTKVSAEGPDRGKDIVASPDGFGFESPRIVVEVKHRPGTAMGAQQLRSFLGGRHKDDKGLYVSTGGFTKDALYEAERANIPIALMSLDDLVTALIDHYHLLDSETRQLVPLTKVFWPA